MVEIGISLNMVQCVQYCTFGLAKSNPTELRHHQSILLPEVETKCLWTIREAPRGPPRGCSVG